MRKIQRRELFQLRALLIKNWWIKKHHGILGVAIEILFPIIMTLLVAAFFLEASQPSGNYLAGTTSRLSDFTAYQECIARSPLTMNPRNELANTTYQAWNDTCVVGVTSRFESPGNPTLAESSYYDELVEHVTSALKVPYVLLQDSEQIFAEARKYTIWAGITLDCRNPVVNASSALPYAIHITASLLPAAMYPAQEPNVFFSLISTYLARGALKFEYSGFYYLQSVVEPALLNFKLRHLAASLGDAAPQPIAFQLWTAPYKSLSTNVPLVILLSASLLQISYIPTIFYACFDLVNERRSKNYMKAMGMGELLYYLSWAIYIAASLLLTSMVIYVGSAILGVMNGIAGRALIIVLLYALSLCSLVFLIASLSRSKQVAAVFILTVIGFVPNSLAIFLTNSSFAAKAIFSLFSPVAFVFSIVECLKSHLIQANHLAVIPDDLAALGTYSMPFGVLMLILDSLIYLLLSWYFHNTYTKKNPRPPYFLFTKTYWKPQQRRRDQLPPNEEMGESEEPIDLESSQSGSFINLPHTARGSRPVDGHVHHENFEPIWQPKAEQSAVDMHAEKKRVMMEELNRLGSFVQAQDPRRQYATTRLRSAFGIGVQLKNVEKLFHGNAEMIEDHDVHAVKNVSFEALRNEVFVIVGENGSGKSTLMQMLAGLIPYTDGHILVEGFDMRWHRRQVRDRMSLCAQESNLMNCLSVREHILLASRLKCMPDMDEQGRIDTLLASLNLLAIADQDIKICSRSEKKRVSLAIAFASDAKVVLLDEPTTGLDPESREVIWNVIQSQKAGRTVVITTHLMAEADALGDRVALMKQGSIIACGSPTFLKRRFGVGYYLNIEKLPEAPVTPIAEFILQRVPSSRVVMQAVPSPTKIKFTLPFSDQPSYPDLFQDMEAQIDAHSNLGIESFAVSLTTLEAIFDQQVNREPDVDPNDGINAFDQYEDGVDVAPSLASSTESAREYSTQNGKDILPSAATHVGAPIWHQVKMLVKMRFKMWLRNRGSLIFLLVVPFIAVTLIWLAAALGPSYLQLPQILNGSKTSATTDPVSLNFATAFPLHIPYVWNELTSEPLGRARRDFSDGFEDIPSYWREAYADSGNLAATGFLTHNDLGHFLWQDANPGHRFTSWVVDGWSFEEKTHQLGILFNKSESYSLPLSLNLLSNSVLAAYIARLPASEPNYSESSFSRHSLQSTNSTREEMRDWMSSIQLTMAPLDPVPNIKSITYNFDMSLLSSFTLFDVSWALGLSTCMAVVLALLTQERVRERVMKVKLQQMLMGASLNVVWISTLIVDSVRILLVYLVVVITGVIFQFEMLKGMYFGAFALLLILAVPSFLFMAYFVSRFFRVPKSCYKWILLLFWSMYIVDYVIGFAVQISRLVVLKTVSNELSSLSTFFLSYFSFLNPFSTLSSAMFELSTVQKDFSLKHITASFSYLMAWQRLGIHVFFLTMHALMWGAILFGSGYLETTLRNPSKSSARTAASESELELEVRMEEEEVARRSSSDLEPDWVEEEDQDVRRVRHRINAGEYENAVVRVADLAKAVPTNSWWQLIKQMWVANKVDSFKDIADHAEDINHGDLSADSALWHSENAENTLISRIYMVVSPGECFGVVGPQGSGKSSLLSLLIGEQTPSQGTVEINGQSIYCNQSHLYRTSLMSYAPPGNFFSGFEDLTVLENLQLFFQLRNLVTTHELNAMVDFTLHKMQLKPYAAFLCKNLNWQIKRRLSIGIALFTGNAVAFLDEPTYNMDVTAKSQMWRIFQDVRKMTGIAIVLTSNSMNEANATCDHFGIFVKGRIQAMGSKEYLKNRFEEGYYLKVLIADQNKTTSRYLVDDTENGDSTTLEGQDEVINLEEDPKKVMESLAASIDDFVHENFSNSRKLVAYGRERTYFLGLLESPAWAFDLLETNKLPLKIQEYSLSQTTLVDVFTQFARNQEIPTQ
jgi:ABC-type multidrug transport system ATPase subunit